MEKIDTGESLRGYAVGHHTTGTTARMANWAELINERRFLL